MMLNRIAVSHCAKWSRNRKMVNYSFHTKVCGDRKQFVPLQTLDIESRYNQQTIEKVLDVLNTKNVNELMRYDITKGRLQKMEAYRKKNGPFINFEQILEVDDFGAKILEKFVISIIEGPKEKKTNSNEMLMLLRNLVTPVLDDAKKSNIGTVTSIHVGRQQVGWAHMETSGHLLSWDSYGNFEWPKKDNTKHLHNMAMRILNELPRSDVYVMEEIDTQMHSLANSQSYTIITNLQRLQLTTMLITLIATNFDHSNENGSCWTQINNYYLLRPKVTDQLFHLLFGNESVSAYTLINQMMNNNVAEQCRHILPVKIDVLGSEMYKKSDSLKKESLSQALLLSVAFIDLILHCNPISLNRLMSRKRASAYD